MRDAVAGRHRDVPLGIFSAGHGVSGRSLNHGLAITSGDYGGVGVGGLADFLTRWGAAIEAADRSVCGEVILGGRQGGRQFAQALLVVDSDDSEVIIERLQPIAGVAPLLDQSIALTGYDQLMQAMLSEAPQLRDRDWPEVLERAFPPGHLTRLRALKRRYDPTGLFRDNFFIDPGAVDGAA